MVSPAGGITQAFDLLEQHKFDLVIIGHDVPTAERRLLFLEINRKWDIPILLIDSGEADPLIRARGHISKDATFEKLLEAVAALAPKPDKKPLAHKRTPARTHPGC